MEELWKDIKNYEGYYQASNLGRIKSLLFQNNVYNKKYKRDKILRYKGQTYKTGYRVDLWKDGVCKTLLVARLVAFTFFDKDINDHNLTVNHKDGNRFNNNIKNLELISLGDNIRHAFNTGLMPYKKIKLTNKLTKEERIFNSMALASVFMNKNKGYVSGQMIDKKFENSNYRWEVL